MQFEQKIKQLINSDKTVRFRLKSATKSAVENLICGTVSITKSDKPAGETIIA